MQYFVSPNKTMQHSPTAAEIVSRLQLQCQHLMIRGELRSNLTTGGRRRRSSNLVPSPAAGRDARSNGRGCAQGDHQTASTHEEWTTCTRAGSRIPSTTAAILGRSTANQQKHTQHPGSAAAAAISNHSMTHPLTRPTPL